jgi:hypothetical protein
VPRLTVVDLVQSKEMSKAAHSAHSGHSAKTVPHRSELPAIQKLSVGRELLDTTWRMTVPVILFAGLGIAADKALGSQPWVTLLGTIVGFVFATLLVKRQIDRGESDNGSESGPTSTKNSSSKDTEAT